METNGKMVERLKAWMYILITAGSVLFAAGALHGSFRGMQEEVDEIRADQTSLKACLDDVRITQRELVVELKAVNKTLDLMMEEVRDYRDGRK